MKTKKFFSKLSMWCILCGFGCFALATCFALIGLRRSQEAQSMTGQLKQMAGTGWYPIDGVNYDIEARIVGQETWARQALNVKSTDVIEARLRVATGDITTIDTLLPANIVNGVRYSNGLDSQDELPLDLTFDQLSPEHVVYISLGTYAFSHDLAPWSLSVAKLAAMHGGKTLSEMLIVPPYSEMDNEAIMTCAILGVISWLGAIITTLLSKR